MGGVEEAVRGAVGWLRLGVEVTGAAIVGIGVVLALALFVRSSLSRRPTNFNAIRLVLARYLALALEFQLASDILTTAIAPSWGEIGKLAAVAVIRTALNHFLGHEIQQEQAAERDEQAVVARAAGPASVPAPGRPG